MIETVDNSHVPSFVREANLRFGLFSTGQTVLVAASGGADSTALLHVLCAAREEFGITVLSAHLNHGFRGVESDGDAEYVRALSRSLGIVCYDEFIDVPAIKRRRGLSSQQAAREARRRFLERTRLAVGADVLAIGHTRDDRIETVLLNIIRGSGLEGLAALPPMRLPIVRPLCLVTREETQAYCDLHALQPRTDSSNLKTDYLRNRMRSELLPMVAAYYNEKIGDAVLRLSDLAGEDSAVLDALARERLAEALLTGEPDREEPEQLLINADLLRSAPIAVRRRMIRLGIERIRGSLTDIEFGSVERVLKALEAWGENSWILPAGESGGAQFEVHVRTELRAVSIQRVRPPACALPWRQSVNIPGETENSRRGFTLHSRCISGVSELRRFAATLDDLPIIFREIDISMPVAIRSWKAGDRIRPQGLGGTKKVQDLLTDRKVGRARRGETALLVDSGGDGRVLAVLGHQADALAIGAGELDRLEADCEQQDVERFLVFYTSASAPE